MSHLRIGIDFDNTIISYDDIFHKVALEEKLIPPDLPTTKADIRDYLREREKEDEWTTMQGYVYGVRLKDANPFPGVADFLLDCKRKNISVFIVSHKTRHPYIGHKYNLHSAAYEWLKSQSFLDAEKFGLTDNNIYFELTKSEKIKRISKLKCSHFIDDLPEFLSEEDFPLYTDRILFDPNKKHPEKSIYYRITSWEKIRNYFNFIHEKDRKY